MFVLVGCNQDQKEILSRPVKQEATLPTQLAQTEPSIAPVKKQKVDEQNKKEDLGAANRWLKQQAKQVKSIEVTYGSDWPGQIWKTLWITDERCIQQTLTSLDCRGDLENSKGPKSDDGLPNYDTHYRVVLNYIDPKKFQVAFGIYRGSYRPGVYYVARGYSGWAETDGKSVDKFHSLINKCFSKSKVERH